MANKVDPVAVGKRIQNLRILKGYKTAPEFSRALGPDDDGVYVPTSTISRWETGAAYPRNTIDRIAETLDTSIDWLRFGDREALPASPSVIDVVDAYLASERGNTTNPVVAEQLAEEGAFDGLLGADVVPTDDQVHALRVMLDRARVGTGALKSGPPPKATPQGASGTRTRGGRSLAPAQPAPGKRRKGS